MQARPERTCSEGKERLRRLENRWSVSWRSGFRQTFASRRQSRGGVPAASQIDIGGHALAPFIELPEVEGRATVAAGGGARIPDGGLRHVARCAAAAVEHDRNVERRPCVTKIRCAPHCGEGLDGVRRSRRADIQRQRPLKPDLRLRRALLLRPLAREGPKFRRRALSSRPLRWRVQRTRASSRSSLRRHLQVISTRRFWTSATPWLVGTGRSVSPLARTWNRSAGMPRASRPRSTASARR